ncbi:hypothetical protein [Cellulomonas sp. KRMCY2]|uniref:hypothetical protein n=1 Tax=Cellulomonas sp. KRMCY2 TaxID=1304865 RepID=UPI00045EAFF5|nr:hypothetical protein [Cellulomonas sp. KRMCY2]
MAKQQVVTDDHITELEAALDGRVDAEAALTAARAAYALTVERVYRTGGYSTYALGAALETSHQRVYALIREGRAHAGAHQTTSH